MADDDSSSHILSGFTELLNTNNVKDDIDIKDLERRLIEGGMASNSKSEPANLDTDLKNTMAQLGISSDEDNNSTAVIDDDNDDDQPSAASGPTIPSFLSSSSGSMGGQTQEQIRREHINSVLQENSAEEMFSAFDEEKNEDEKLILLDEIESFITILKQDEIDLSHIPTVDKNSSLKEIKAIHKRLSLKNRSAAATSMAEELIIFGAYAMEELCDGKKTWLGLYRPDLVGWHTHVQTKLRRMRGDTSALVNSFIQNNNIGPGTRILFELIPNMLIYSKMKKERHETNSLYSDEEIKLASDNIRNFDSH
ncbi:MAG: hypothetical protein ACYCPT_09140 [Acidimicrobiales bacterium]